MALSYKEVLKRMEKVKSRYSEAFLRKKYPDWVDYLLKPLGEATSDREMPNVRVTYVDFHQWMAIYDWNMVRDLELNIRSYRAQREIHENSIRKELNMIRRMKSGHALFREIARGPDLLAILPYIHWDFKEYDKMNSSARPLPDGGVLILHTKYMWGPTGTSGFSGPGLNPDEVLYHELVHATRELKGIRSKRPVNRNYDNEEEYLAVVITNIYLSEKWGGTSWLRSGHDAGTRLIAPGLFLENSEGIDYPPRELIKAFRGAQHAFYMDLARIDAPFNPIRQFKQE